MASYLIFIKSNNLVYIDAQFIKVVIPFDWLVNEEVLYRYYIMSLAMTENVKTLKWFNEGSWGNQEDNEGKWCITAKVYWKQMYFTCFFENLVGFKSNPEYWKFSISSEKKINMFFDMLDNVKIISYPGIGISDHYLSSEIDEITKNIIEIENNCIKV